MISARHLVTLKIRTAQRWAAIFSAAFVLALLGTTSAANHLPFASLRAYQATQVLLFGRLGMALIDLQLTFWAVTAVALGVLRILDSREKDKWTEELLPRLTVHAGGKKQPQPVRCNVLIFRREK